MERLTCEMCGSTDMVKESEVFVCQRCGTKYSAENSQKIIANFSELIKSEQNNKIKNYYDLALNYLDVDEYRKAIATCDSLLALDANSFAGWTLRMEIELFKIKQDILHGKSEVGINQTLFYANKALDNCDDNNKLTFISLVIEKLFDNTLRFVKSAFFYKNAGKLEAMFAALLEAMDNEKDKYNLAKNIDSQGNSIYNLAQSIDVKDSSIYSLARLVVNKMDAQDSSYHIAEDIVEMLDAKKHARFLAISINNSLLHLIQREIISLLETIDHNELIQKFVSNYRQELMWLAEAFSTDNNLTMSRVDIYTYIHLNLSSTEEEELEALSLRADSLAIEYNTTKDKYRLKDIVDDFVYVVKKIKKINTDYPISKSVQSLLEQIQKKKKDEEEQKKKAIALEQKLKARMSELAKQYKAEKSKLKKGLFSSRANAKVLIEIGGIKAEIHKITRQLEKKPLSEIEIKAIEMFELRNMDENTIKNTLTTKYGYSSSDVTSAMVAIDVSAIVSNKYIEN
ncbi:MAG: hypothetical protein J1G06_00305 [Oscillospiraceae bacterium]|nr:hypothetical protein [Oscillospiraceae bacterium]